jgi:hypothetical protein
MYTVFLIGLRTPLRRRWRSSPNRLGRRSPCYSRSVIVGQASERKVEAVQIGGDAAVVNGTSIFQGPDSDSCISRTYHFNTHH